jgi:ABC-type transport system substrate-binding protein
MRKRLVSVLAVSAMVFAACGGTQATASPAGSVAPPPSGSTAAPATTAPSTGPASADFKFAVDGEPTYFSLAYTDLPTSWIVGLLYTGMYRADNKLAPTPDMATALPDVSADGLTWTVKLKSGIKWTDGSDFTSDDVKFTFDLALSKNCTFIPSFCGDAALNLDSVTAPDPATVVFKLKNKFAPFLITDLTTPIMPKAAVTASFARFQAAAGKVDATAVKALADKVDAATTDKACDGTDKAPTTCNFATYTADMEGFLNTAGVTLPDKNTFKKDDGTTDDEAYASAVHDQLVDLNKGLASSANDQIAADFRIIDFNKAPVGTGPYKFASYKPAESVTLDRNDNYYAGTVGPAHVFIPIIKDAASASAALQKGDINWQTEVTSDALAAVKADPNLQVVEHPDFGYYFIAFNLRPDHIYSDLKLRQAFSMCIDHDATVQAATDGNGAPVYANVPPASWAFDPNTPKYTLDVAGAKALIEGEGWALGSDGIYAKGGKKLSTDLFVRQGRPQRVKFGQLAKDQLAKCGININVKESDFATVLLPLLSYPNKFDTYLGGWSTALDPDDSSIFGVDQITTKAAPDGNNFPGWNNPQADALLKQGREELDQAKRKDIYSQFQAIVHNDVPYYFLWADLAHAGITKTVSATPNTVAASGTIDLTSPVYYWNNDTWVVSSK